MLLFLGYLLDSNDLHHENVIRSGDHPVIIDLETLLHPWVAPLPGTPTELLTFTMDDSVIRTGLLPNPAEAERGLPDLSGFREGAQPAMGSPLRWTAVNSDVMALSEHPIHQSQEVVVPATPGRTLDRPALQAGFIELYRLFCERKDDLAGVNSPLSAFAGRPARFVFRATEAYGHLLTQSLKPAYMRDGAERSVLFDVLARVTSPYVERPTFWPLLKEEQRALESLDVPLFIGRSDSVDLPLPASGEMAKGYFRESGTTRMWTRLRTLSEQGLARQLGIIQGALRPLTVEAS